MLDFVSPTIADRERGLSFIRSSGQMGCDMSYAATYLWKEPVVMTLASEINDETADVGFEKAEDVSEAFAVINNAFARHFTKYTYLNREEDMGIDGLRKAKLSYRPDILYRKYAVQFTE